MFVQHDYMYKYIYDQLKNAGKCHYTYRVYTAALQMDMYKLTETYLQFLQHHTILRRRTLYLNEPHQWILKPSVSMCISTMPGDTIYRKDKNICVTIPATYCPTNTTELLWFIISGDDIPILDVLFYATQHHCEKCIDSLLLYTSYILPFELPKIPCISVQCPIHWKFPIHNKHIFTTIPLSHIKHFIQSISTTEFWNYIMNHIDILEHTTTISSNEENDHTYTIIFYQTNKDHGVYNGICSIYDRILQYTTTCKHEPFYTFTQPYKINTYYWPILIHNSIHQTSPQKHMLLSLDKTSVITQTLSFDQECCIHKSYESTHNSPMFIITDNMLQIVQMVNDLHQHISGNMHIIFPSQYCLNVYHHAYQHKYKAQQNIVSPILSVYVKGSNCIHTKCSLIIFITVHTVHISPNNTLTPTICFATHINDIQSSHHNTCIFNFPSTNTKLPITCVPQQLETMFHSYQTISQPIHIIKCTIENYILQHKQTQYKKNNKLWYQCMVTYCTYINTNNDVLKSYLVDCIQDCSVDTVYQQQNHTQTLSITKQYDNCSICMQHLRYPRQLQCRHTFCQSCLYKHTITFSNLKCPTCRFPILIMSKPQPHVVCSLPKFTTMSTYSDTSFFKIQLNTILNTKKTTQHGLKVKTLCEYLKNIYFTKKVSSLTETLYIYTHHVRLVQYLNTIFPNRSIRLHTSTTIENVKNIIVVNFDEYYPVLLQKHFCGYITIHAVIVYKDSIEEECISVYTKVIY
jgi:hypothetical protein